MGTLTFAPLAKNILTSNQTSITFSNINQGFTDLVLIASIRSTYGATFDAIYLTPNSITTGHHNTQLFAYSTATGTGLDQYGDARQMIGWTSANSATANTFGVVQCYIPNYTTSNKKSFSSTAISENNATTSEASYQAAIAGFTDTTEAITSLTLRMNNGSISSGSSYYLYGVTRA